MNEASRLEALCKTVDTQLLVSASFASTAAVEGVVDLGEHVLKGVKAPIRVYTLGSMRPAGASRDESQRARPVG